MKKMRNKGIVLVVMVALLVMNFAMVAMAEDVKVEPQITVVGNTVYVDVDDEQSWNSLQVNLTYDKSAKVAEYGQTEEFQEAIVQQEGLLGFPLCNAIEGEFIAAAAYTSTAADGSGVDYTGHVFYVTFEEESTPLEVELRNDEGEVIAKAVVDGSEEEQVVTEGVGMEDNLKVIIIVVIGVVVVIALIVAAVVSSKNKKDNEEETKKATAQEDDEDEE